MEPREYDIIPFDAEGNELKRHRTSGGWSIEGNFLITWTKDGEKQASRIPNSIARFETKPVDILESFPLRKVVPDDLASPE